MSNKIIGIDLGTTYSCVAIIRNDKVEIVQDISHAKKIILSIDCFKDFNQRLIGCQQKITGFNFMNQQCLILKDY